MKSFNKLKICSILSLFILIGCGQAPDVHPRQILRNHGICNQYVIKYGNKLTLEFEKEIPLDECLENGSFVVTAKELLEVKRAYDDYCSIQDKKKRGKKCPRN